jgi:hypothetical protein
MNIKALITTLVLGSSSLAFADHYEGSYAPAPATAPAVRDHRMLPPTPAPAPVQQSWGGWHKPVLQPVLLADNTRVTGRALIQVPTSTRAFTKLELKSNNGRTSIDRVVIVFGNGQRQVAKLGSIVNGKGSLTIDLDGGARNIKSIMLVGNSARRGSIDVLAV